MGAPNTSVTILKINPTTSEYKILYCNMFDYCISSLLDKKITKRQKIHRPFIEQYYLFNRHARNLIKSYLPDEVYVERFMNRGPRTGLTSELVNIMIAGWFQHAIDHRAKPHLVTAASWKNEFTRCVSNIELKDFYKEIRPVKPHQLDSLLIGLYSIGDKKVYQTFNSIEHRQYIKNICMSF